MKYLLDTNAVSALMKANPALVERLQQVERSNVTIPQPVIAEIEYGISRLPKSKRRAALRQRFDLICVELGRSPWTDSVSEHFGTIKAGLEAAGKPIEDFDAAIAAHALVHGAVLVTANLDHMTRVPGLRVEDWAATG